MYNFISIERLDQVTVITIDRPPLNIMNAAAWDEIGACMDQAAQDGSRAIVITGAGQRAFCAGSDINDMLDLDAVTGTAWSRRNYAVREKIRHYDWPVICAINGLALGGGMALALVCDIRVAGRSAQFGLPEAHVGLVGTANYLLRYLPPGKVKEMVFTNRRLTAEEAYQWGLVEELVDDEKVLETAIALARESLQNAPTAIRLYKRSINQGLEMGLESSLGLELDYLKDCWSSQERRDWVLRYYEMRRKKKEEKERATAHE